MSMSPVSNRVLKKEWEHAFKHESEESGQQKVKGSIGVDSAREPGPPLTPAITVVVPTNPLQQAGGLHSCLSHPALCPEVLAAQGTGGEGIRRVTGWVQPLQLWRDLSHSLGLPLSPPLP